MWKLSSFELLCSDVIIVANVCSVDPWSDKIVAHYNSNY